MKFPKMATAGVIAAAVIGIAACGGSGNGTKQASTVRSETDSNGPTISVSGHRKVEGTPDTATVTMGVETHDASAQAAMTRNNVEATALIDALKAKGVAAKDIQTTDLSVYPSMDDKGNVTGYVVSNTVTVR